ncbi:NAD(P)/FAD-dependent oxidoreductase [Caballeronia ptereochthonis]|uniref:FAD-dependent pyridine nucleotide-disulfide oxidoreductase n=1 Tax=Caballeronia ptereochthonis TaxID=1777144 RepID=A0A158BB10_9BURK|nr:FAD-dependent oxidoreductase [Caballeronia ptereochthonis]SAK67241.1 FAD-dependent pyridine nucleotide-disulfide oxidoreductase [Caballeronia ptereochthonis]
MACGQDGRAMVIVGAGHVGGRAALALREFGWKRRIVMIGAEVHLPYERPPISKQLLTGEREAMHCHLRTHDAWQTDCIEHVVGRAGAIMPDSREVRLEDGSRIEYEALLLATGGHARSLRIPGADLDGVSTLRTLDDAARIAPRLVPGARVVIVGGGFIGLEVAASARKRGCEVCVIEGALRLLGRAVPAGIAEQVLRLHERNGVLVRIGVAPLAIERATDGALRISLSDGRSIAADIVIVGIGIEPADELARDAGLAVNRGVIVSAELETSVPGIFAAGDIAIYPSRFTGQPIRQETWHNAETQARTAARNMLGERATYDDVPWFWSDQYDHQLQVAGEPSLGERAVRRPLGDAGSIDFHFDAHGRLVGASGFGPASVIAKDMKLARMLVERGLSPSAEMLDDAGIGLKALL